MKPLAWNPMNRLPFPIDVTENGGTFAIRAETPGFEKEDIQVSVHGDQVVISAELQKEKSEKEGDQIVQRECARGRQYRSLNLPKRSTTPRRRTETDAPQKGQRQHEKIAVP